MRQTLLHEQVGNIATSEIISPHYGELQVQERQVNLIYIFWQKRGTEYTYEKLWREKSFASFAFAEVNGFKHVKVTKTTK